MFRFAHSHVVITGAASGLGALLTEEAITRGASGVVLWDVDSDNLESRAMALTQPGLRVVTRALDVSDVDQVKAAAAEALRELGHIDALINNAGVVSGKPLLDLTPEEIQRTFNVNTLALYWTTQALMPHFLDRNSGRVVTIASAAGLAAPARQTDYAASKHAAVGFTESLRAELRARKTRVSTLTVYPFYVTTGMFAGVRSSSPLLPLLQPESTARKIADAIESGRQELVIPATVHLVRWLRLLPVRVFDLIADWFGINKSMDQFVGRQQ